MHPRGLLGPPTAPPELSWSSLGPLWRPLGPQGTSPRPSKGPEALSDATPGTPYFEKQIKTYGFSTIRRCPNSSKRAPRRLPETPFGTPRDPKDPLMTPRPPQGPSRTPPSTPRDPPRGPKDSPRPHQDPRGLPWRTSGNDFALYEKRCISAGRQKSGTIGKK